MMFNFSNKWTQNCVLLAPLLLLACGEIAYKRGASANDLDKTRKACAAKDSTKTAIEKCMIDNGWAFQNLESSELISNMQNEPEPIIAKSITKSNSHEEIPIITKNVTGDRTVNTPGNMKPTDPMETFKIGSWWKLGGGSVNLKLSIQECVTTLGEAYQPDPQTKKVTRGLLQCMKSKGWHGLIENSQQI